MELKGKIAVVTGAGRGLGRAIALAFVREGAKVTAFSEISAELEETADLATELSGEVHAVAGDVSRPEDALRALAETHSRFGPADVLVNNAAVIGPPRFYEDADPAAWTRSLGANLSGAAYFSRAVLPDFLSRRSGKIVSVTSGLGRMAFPRFCAYAVTKAGIDHLTRCLADELEPYGIQVNALDPGVMDTPMQAEIRAMGPAVLGPEVHERFVALHDQGLLDDPARAARLAVFLASSASDRITGRVGTEEDYRRLGFRR